MEGNSSTADDLAGIKLCPEWCPQVGEFRGLCKGSDFGRESLAVYIQDHIRTVLAWHAGVEDKLEGVYDRRDELSIVVF